MTGMRIGLIGDVHGHWRDFAAVCRVLADRYGCAAVIQVGDCGLSQDTVERHRGLRFPIPVCAVDGNHDDHALLAALRDGDPADDPWAPMGLQWMRRGQVTVWDDRIIGWCGGALQVDTDQETWPPVQPWEDLPMQGDHATYPMITDAERLIASLEGRRPDLIVSHSCPSGVGLGMVANDAYAWSMQVHVRDRGCDPGPDGDAGEPALRHLWQRLGPARPAQWIHGHWHTPRSTTITGTTVTSLPPCDPDLGRWIPMWIGMDTLAVDRANAISLPSLRDMAGEEHRYVDPCRSAGTTPPGTTHHDR